MFENTDVAWIKSLSPDVPTIGHMLRKAGYYTAYKGKWHLNKEFDTQEPDKLFSREMEAYGFSDYVSPGDLIGHTLGGYEFDQVIASTAVTWLRRVGRPLSNEGRPWSLFMSLVNPSTPTRQGRRSRTRASCSSARPPHPITRSTGRRGTCRWRHRSAKRWMPRAVRGPTASS
jgi:arylsulfatase A-like enzyme